MPTSCLFDRALKQKQLARAAKDFAQHSALFDDAVEQLMARLAEVKRAFPSALDLSPFPFLERHGLSALSRKGGFDEEDLPFEAQSFDLAVSNMGLHWVNDLPRALTQIHEVLKPGGLFLAAMIGENSLHELRASLFDAEMAVTGGVSPRVSPMIRLQDAGRELTRAGFQLPVADMETVTLVYADLFALMRELRGMGQTNALVERKNVPTKRLVFEKADELYRQRFGNSKGHIPASFDIVYLHGWKAL